MYHNPQRPLIPMPWNSCADSGGLRVCRGCTVIRLRDTCTRSTAWVCAGSVRGIGLRGLEGQDLVCRAALPGGCGDALEEINQGRVENRPPTTMRPGAGQYWGLGCSQHSTLSSVCMHVQGREMPTGHSAWPGKSCMQHQKGSPPALIYSANNCKRRSASSVHRGAAAAAAASGSGVSGSSGGGSSVGGRRTLPAPRWA